MVLGYKKKKLIIGLIITSSVISCALMYNRNSWAKPIFNYIVRSYYKPCTCGNNDYSEKKVNQGYKWEKVTCYAEFKPRDGAGAYVYRDSMFLVGGWDGRKESPYPRVCTNGVWSSKDGIKWINTKKNSFLTPDLKDGERDWAGRHTFGSIVFKNKMWIIGGDANQGKYQNDIWNSDDGKNWTKVTDSVPWGPRVLHISFSFLGRIWVIGGQTLPQFAKAQEAFYNDVWSSEDGINWIKHASKLPFPQRGMIYGTFEFQDKIWIVGGGTYDTPKNIDRKYYNDVWSSKDGVNWELVSKENKWAGREYHSVNVWDNKLWITGGYAGTIKGNLNDVWFSSDGKKWEELKDTPWCPRHAHSTFVFNNSLWVVAGSNMESDVWRLSKIEY